jgi:[protein-PII] uridylyltransferase
MKLAAPAAAERYWQAGADAAPAALKAALDAGDQALQADFRADPARVGELLRARAWLVEQVVLNVWSRHVPMAGATLVAVGGFGRGELYPRSDVDLLVLLPPGRPAALTAAVEHFFAALWDVGLHVGHAVRTPAECEEAAADITVMTNLLESRELAGSRDLYREMLAAIAPVRVWSVAAFSQGKRHEQAQRHARYNDTAYNLEPNLKEGPGGLRDLHTVVWIARRQLGADSLAALAERGLLAPTEQAALVDAAGALARIRYALHLVARRAEERLLFEHQRELARWFGHADQHAQNLAVEQFMQGYYRAAMTVERLCERLLQRLDEHAQGLPEAEPVDSDFCVAGGLLDTREPELFERDPVAIVRAFRVLLDHPDLRGFRSTLLARLDAALPQLDGRLGKDLALRDAILGILRHPGAVADVLQRMSRYGVLARLLPAFGKVTGRMQYDLFHVYTVDQHTLFVIRNLRSFADPRSAAQFALAHEVYQRLRKPELLLLGGLFHDIAKGRGGDHSELGAADAIAFCRDLGLSDADGDLVAWLVRQHLTMSITSQKQDISDPAVVHRFATLVEDSERLDYLYVLTVADIRATSPKLWNSWKDRLLAELYRATRYALLRGLEHPVHADERVAETQRAAQALLARDGVDPAAVEALWRSYPADSFLRYTAEQIAWQTRAILAAAGALPLVAVRRSPERGSTELFVHSPDRDGLFATITATIDRQQMSVVDARIVNSGDGKSLDTFQLLEADGHPIADTSREQQLVLRLRDELSRDVLSARPARRAVSRKLRQFEIPTRLDFGIAPNGRTQLALTCADRPGLLAHVAAAFRECGVRVHDARIATFGERVEDFFELTDDRDQPLDPQRIADVESAVGRHILHTEGQSGLATA